MRKAGCKVKMNYQNVPIAGLGVAHTLKCLQNSPPILKILAVFIFIFHLVKI